MPLDRIDIIKSQAKMAIAQFLDDVDPVAEIRRALHDTGVLIARPQSKPSMLAKDVVSNG